MFLQILIVALILAVGTLALWMAARIRRDARQSRDWPTAPGKIVERGVETMQTDARSYTPKVTYAYTVAGKDYVGRQVYRTGSIGSLKQAAQRLVDSLPDPIPVHYNPQNPSQAYLLSDPSRVFWIALVFGIGALLWGFLQGLTLLVR